MTKLIKPGIRTFRITCNTCEAQYSYDIHDLDNFTNSATVKCPCCGTANYHYTRDRVIEEDNDNA